MSSKVFNWFVSGDEKETMQNNMQLLLKQEKLNHEELENVKVQLKTIMDKFEKESELKAEQGELFQNELNNKLQLLNNELQLLQSKEDEWEKIVEKKEQEIVELKEREKSYLQKIKHFTTNLQMMQQNSKAAPQNPASGNQSSSTSPFLKNHQVPPRLEDYIKDQY